MGQWGSGKGEVTRRRRPGEMSGSERRACRCAAAWPQGLSCLLCSAGLPQSADGKLGDVAGAARGPGARHGRRLPRLHRGQRRGDESERERDKLPLFKLLRGPLTSIRQNQALSTDPSRIFMLARLEHDQSAVHQHCNKAVVNGESIVRQALARVHRLQGSSVSPLHKALRCACLPPAALLASAAPALAAPVPFLGRKGPRYHPGVAVVARKLGDTRRGPFYDCGGLYVTGSWGG